MTENIIFAKTKTTGHMKFIFSTIICLLATISLSAQPQHLTFKGIPIDGTLAEFTQALESVGFEVSDEEADYVKLEGDFAGHKNCMIHTSVLQNRNLVNHVAIQFPKSTSWNDLYNDYSQLKELLTQKYGQPSSIQEEFIDFEPDTDQGRFQATQMDNCRYNCEFNIDNGTIILSIDYRFLYGSYPLLRYYDKTNTEIIRADAINDL